MPRRSILSFTERQSLVAVPDDHHELIRLYSMSDADLMLVKQHRGAQNRLGFAVLLCYMRYPGILLGVGAEPSAHLLTLIANELKVSPEVWNDYGRQRAETRREHLLELQAAYGFQSFTTLRHYRAAVHSLGELASQTDKGIVLAHALADSLRSQGILLPTIDVMERICAEAITRANKHIHAALSAPLTRVHRQRLDELLAQKEGGKTTQLA